jgi:hypothetical protein
MSHGSATWPLSTNRLVFHITLRDVDGFEGFDSREFDLALNAKFPIGRASKNTTKQELMPSSNNAYIDSPVISRNHAVLSAHADNGTAQVFVTDLGSMHGTTVNGERLQTHTPKQLSSGDKLQFGIDVNRNEGKHPERSTLSPSSLCSTDMPPLSEFFVARKYRFEACLDRAPAAFSMGFTVPDSDGEDIDGTTPRRGSQYNPLTIDDSDSESEPSDDEHVDTTLVGARPFVENLDEDEPPAMADMHLRKETFPPTVDEATLVEQDYSENEGTGYYSSEVQEDDLEDFNTEASIMGDSIVEYDSDIAVAEVQHEATSDAAGRQTETVTAQSQPVQDSQLPTHTSFSSRSLFEPSSTMDSMQNVPRQAFEHAFTNSFPPPLPPRPSTAQLPTSNRPPWYSNAIPAYPTWLDTNNDRPMLFSSSAYVVPLDSADIYGTGGGSNTAPTSDRIQTPPPMLPSDVACSSTPPPSRRTKVSIGEIVEEQPPTPESLNGLKRKADVLEEGDVPILESLVPQAIHVADVVALKELSVHRTDDDKMSQTAAVITQRPKKQPRSIIGRINTSAKYLGIGAAGAAGALAVLSALPDAFFF